MPSEQDIKIFAGAANAPLAEAIADFLDIPLGAMRRRNFSDGELFLEIGENVRGADVFIIQPTSNPVNEHLMELLIMADALKRSSARSICAVIPYYGYARQDRKVSPRTPITAKLVADLLSAAGITRLLSIDLHAGQIQGFFNIPVDHLFATPILLEHMKKTLDPKETVIVSPDAGGVERARAYAEHLGCDLAIIDKRRPRANVAEVMNIVGDVSGRDVVIVDDMADTAGTLTHSAQALMDNGARRVLAYITHPVLSGPALERIDNSPIDKIVVTDTIALRSDIK
ncbi:ribose-phosphate pyrophosphokinase, partial [Myxococcota bacterium]|nr:ribose-phosphate pyrophosphokinase [Myxococcota bacterium]